MEAYKEKFNENTKYSEMKNIPLLTKYSLPILFGGRFYQ